MPNNVLSFEKNTKIAVYCGFRKHKICEYWEHFNFLSKVKQCENQSFIQAVFESVYSEITK